MASFVLLVTGRAHHGVVHIHLLLRGGARALHVVLLLHAVHPLGGGVSLHAQYTFGFGMVLTCYVSCSFVCSLSCMLGFVMVLFIGKTGYKPIAR